MATNNGRLGSRNQNRRSGTGLAAAVLAALLALVWGVDSLQDTGQAPTAASEAPALSGDAADAGQFSSLPAISADDLPVEALDTLTLINNGGPFPFDRDGLTFQNREGLLPDHAQGHYQEFTVITPGSDDRGARRIVAGADGELYYTADHYSSFSEIVGWRQ